MNPSRDNDPSFFLLSIVISNPDPGEDQIFGRVTLATGTSSHTPALAWGREARGCEPKCLGGASLKKRSH